MEHTLAQREFVYKEMRSGEFKEYIMRTLGNEVD